MNRGTPKINKYGFKQTKKAIIIIPIPIFDFISDLGQISHNGFVYGKLRVCVRGFSEGKSEASKRATNFGLAKTSNFFYTVLPFRCFFSYNFWSVVFFCVSLISPVQQLRTALVSQTFLIP